MNLNNWCIDGTHLPEDGGPYPYVSSTVERAFVDAYNNWQGILKWIYYGNEQGILFNMPGFHKTDRDGYDPRFR